MRRLLLCTAVVAMLLAAPTGAEAHIDACSGIGTMTTAAGLGLRSLHGAAGFRTTLFALTLGTGGCTSKGFSATGTISGWCDSFYGYGTTSSGHAFAMTGGGFVLFNGNVKGLGVIVHDFTTAGSCQTTTANRFLVSLAVKKTHFIPPLGPQPLEAYCNTTTTEC